MTIKNINVRIVYKYFIQIKRLFHMQLNNDYMTGTKIG